MTWAKFLGREATKEEKAIIRAKKKEREYCQKHKKEHGSCVGCAFHIQFEGCWLYAGFEPCGHDLSFVEQVGDTEHKIA